MSRSRIIELPTQLIALLVPQWLPTQLMEMGNAYKQCAAFLLDSFDTHAAKSPKKRLVSQSKEQEAKLEGEEGRNVQWRILHTCFIILCTSTKLTLS